MARRLTAGALGLAALLALSCVSAFGQESGQPQSTWSDGQGNCGDFDGVGGAQNGTGWATDFKSGTNVVIDGDELTVEFVNLPSGNPLFSLNNWDMTGRVGDDGTFVLRGRSDHNDEDYTYEGRIGTSQVEGTFTRLAHFAGGISGPRCTATWTVRFPASGLDLPAGSGPRTREREADGGGEGSGIIGPALIALILLGLAAVGGGFWFMRPRTKERPPKEAESGDDEDSVVEEDEPEILIEEIGDKVEQPPPVKVSEKLPCECSGYLQIGGRDTLRVCECLELKWETTPSKHEGLVVVRGVFPDGELFCGRRYRPENVIGECTGGGKIYDTVDKVHKWDLVKGPGTDELTLKCSANARFWCERTGWHDLKVEGEKVIKILKVRCRVSIVINEDAYYKVETGHTGVRIRCGEYDTVFGYFATDERPLPNLAGIESEGKIKECSSRNDEQDDSLSIYYQAMRRRQYWFDATCAGCEKLRQSWTDLWKNPGKFDLYQNNCTTAAVELLSGVVKLPAGLTDDFFGWGMKSPATLKELLEEGGLEAQVHEEGQLFHPKDH